jgi:hypothetical protein
MRARIEAAADALRAGAPVFTKRNLYFAVGRASDEAVDKASFEGALRRTPLPGLLSAPAARPRRASGGHAFPEAILMVDRREVLELFVAMAASGLEAPNFAVVCIDGSPAPLVARLARGFEEGLRAPVLYLHDAACVIYPFAIEPLATLVRHRKEEEPMPFRDLGLAPLGASARRFGDPTLPSDDPILELEAIPPATLARYVARSIASLSGGTPS